MADRRRLSGRQIARILTLQERRRERLAARADAAPDDGDAGDPADGAAGAEEEGRVMVRHGASLAIEDGAGQLRLALTRQHLGHPVCGDRVVWRRLGDGQGVVTAILPRQGVLSRPDFSGRDKPLAANLTQLLILIAPEPAPSPYLVDQYLVAAETFGIGALILGHKLDLLTGEARAAFEREFAHYPALGYPLLRTSLREPATLVPLRAALAGQTSILVGQSGVGKSSLTQALLPDRDIQIGRLSQATGLGRHTTSAATCYRLPEGGYLIDSPGVRSFRLGDIDRPTLERGFRDFRPYLGQCRFADCHHRHEPDCAVRAAADAGEIAPRRLANFLHLAQGLGRSAIS